MVRAAAMNALNAGERSEQAVDAVKKTILFDPHHAVYYNIDLAGAYKNPGRYEEGMAAMRKAGL